MSESRWEQVQKIRSGEYVEYGNAVAGWSVSEALVNAAKSIEQIEERDGPVGWVELPRVVPSADEGKVSGRRFGWYGMAKKSPAPSFWEGEVRRLETVLGDAAELLRQAREQRGMEDA